MDQQVTETFIRQLSSDVVDQIAAGEVVERPAHLVKELVENAIDAGATHVEVEYDQGGRRVRVTDNGRGIAQDELKLALARHATSKIQIADDLWNLSTFGFRGEALASIGAVSRLTLTSRTPTSSEAYEVVAEFGRLSEIVAKGGNVGTTVLIEELFTNVPARLKFMKSEAGENAQIKATLRALALAHPAVEFRLKSKGKTEETWTSADGLLERTKQVLGTEPLFFASGSYGEAKAEIVFASPHDVAGSARSITVFVQGRWVHDRSLQAAVIDAYRSVLMHGEFPIAVVKLSVRPSEVDVNIHPTKSQVKFRDPSIAFRAVNRVLREALERAPWLQASDGRAQDGSQNGVMAAVESYSASRKSVAELTRPYNLASPRVESSLEQTDSPSFSAAPVHSTARFELPEFNSIQFKQKVDVASVLDAPVGSGPWSRLQVLGQAHLTYILAQDAERLVMVDQHAAHERVAYEKLMKSWLCGEVDAQPLLLPITVELEPDGAEALLTVREELERIGVLIDQNGPRSVAVRQMPVMIKEKAVVMALKSLAHEIVERGGGFALEGKISDLCASMACHSVVRAGQALSLEQMRSLLSQMDAFPLSSFCPHGRPVSVDYPFSKLERDFGRIV